MSRSSGVDVITRQGLAEALAGVECVIDVASGPSPDQEQATAFFTTAARNLQEAGERGSPISGHRLCITTCCRRRTPRSLPLRICLAHRTHHDQRAAGRLAHPALRRGRALPRSVFRPRVPRVRSRSRRRRSRVIEPGRDRVRLSDLAVVVFKEIGAVAVQDPRAPGAQGAAWRPVSIPSPAASTP